MKNRFLVGILTFYALGSISGFALFGVLDEMRISPKESWAICFDTPATQETFCGLDLFQDIDSCIQMRDWLREMVAETWKHTDYWTENFRIPAPRNHRCNRAKEK